MAPSVPLKHYADARRSTQNYITSEMNKDCFE